MTQTLALFHDAYRELNSKRMFWITLVLSALVVLSFGAVGIDEKGLSVLWWHIPSPFNSNMMAPGVFYRLLFTNLGIGFWLAWIATILALISTAGIFPDLVSSGSIELVLSKPIGRFRLFLTKYLTGLLFTALQVGVFCLASFLVIGFRGGVWDVRLFLAIPLVVLFFSYLFCVCVLIGLLTRSTIASLLLTLLAWFFFFGLNATDGVFVSLRENTQLRIETRTDRIAKMEKGTAQRMRKQAEDKGDKIPDDRVITPAQLDEFNPILANARRSLAEDQESLKTWTRWSRIFYTVKTATPKTSETVELLERWLVTEDELNRIRGPKEDEPLPDNDDLNISPKEQRARMTAALRSRPVSWIIGTSLAFEAVVLGIAAWIFCRRDF